MIGKIIENISKSLGSLHRLCTIGYVYKCSVVKCFVRGYAPTNDRCGMWQLEDNAGKKLHMLF